MRPFVLARIGDMARNTATRTADTEVPIVIDVDPAATSSSGAIIATPDQGGPIQSPDPAGTDTGAQMIEVPIVAVGGDPVGMQRNDPAASARGSAAATVAADRAIDRQVYLSTPDTAVDPANTSSTGAVAPYTETSGPILNEDPTSPSVGLPFVLVSIPSAQSAQSSSYTPSVSTPVSSGSGAGTDTGAPAPAAAASPATLTSDGAVDLASAVTATVAKAKQVASAFESATRLPWWALAAALGATGYLFLNKKGRR